MRLYGSLTGQLRVRLVSADISGAMDAVSAAGILIRNAVLMDELTFGFTIARRDYRLLAAIAEKRGDRLQTDSRTGIYWKIGRLAARPVLAAGLLLLFAMTLFLPSRILIIEVQGNSFVPANRILETAQMCGISFGASRREVRSEKVKNALLEAMPELAWAGVNTYGCRAVISVREREPEPETMEIPEVAHIVAARDGVIVSCDVVSGSGLCVPGQAVEAGEVLISGYTDCGICVTATQAEGEVMAATSRALTAVTPAECIKKGKVLREKVSYSLIVGKIRINFRKNSGISGAGCGRMVTNYQLTLPGGYRVPVTLAKETVFESEQSLCETGGTALQGFGSTYLGTQMIAGTVTQAMELVTEEDGLWVLRGEYACTEMIGRVRAEQNGELHETD